MSRSRRIRPASRWLVGLLLLTLGCQTPAGTKAGTKGHSPLGGPSPTTVASALAPPDASAGPGSSTDALRVVGPGGIAVDLIGKVKLISDKGGGIISNHGGGLISDAGGALIGDAGAGVISNNGSGLVGKTKWRVLAAAAPPEALLADAEITVLDAEGKALVGADHAPIGATTDRQGNYHLSASLPDENLVLRVRLYNGGVLLAFLPRGGSPAGQALDLDTASSLGAAYVLEKYVLKRKEVYARLPASEAAALHQDMEAARSELSGIPTYQLDALVGEAETLKGKVPAVNGRLERIKALLLLGQKDLGNGLPATSVALSEPVGVYRNAAGDTFIAEKRGRIRRIDRAGIISVYAGFGAPDGAPTELGTLNDLIGTPDGTLYVVDGISQRVLKLTATSMTVVAGGGNNSGDGIPATSAQLANPDRVALAPNGDVYVVERQSAPKVGRVLRIDSDGILHALPCPRVGCVPMSLYGVAAAADGTVFVLASAMKDEPQKLLKLAPGAAEWTELLPTLYMDQGEHLVLAPDGKLYFSYSVGSALLRAETTPPADPVHFAEVLVGDNGGHGPYGKENVPAKEAPLNQPRGLWVGADGTMLVVEAGNGLLREISPSGIIRTIAGTTGVAQAGDGTTLSISGPAGLALDGEGRLLFSEQDASTIKRLQDGQVTVVAGSVPGIADGPVATARLTTPGQLAWRNGTLYFLDVNARSLRRLTPAGQVETVFGGHDGFSSAATLPALDVHVKEMTGLAFDPQGRATMCDTGNHVVWRLEADGSARLIAGQNAAEGALGGLGGAFEGDGGPATAARLNSPAGIAYDQAGNLYIADSGNLRIRKVTPAGVISTYAGLPIDQVLHAIGDGKLDTGEVSLAEAMFIAPFALTFDGAGNLYVSEMGTTTKSLAVDFGQVPFEIPTIHARIRRITPAGRVLTVAGEGTTTLSDPEGVDSLLTPWSLLIDAEGRLVVADKLNNQIKVVPKAAL